MRAVVLLGPWEIGVESRPDPAPASGEVLLRVTATGICGSDVHGFTGENGRRHPGQVMGHETVGRIVAVGPDVPDSLAPGTLATVNPLIACGECAACRAGAEQSCARRRVIGVAADISAAFAELMTVPRRNVVPLPEDMPEEYGALVEPLAVGYHAARRGACSAEDTVLVIGGGPIGQACVLAAQRLDVARVAVSEPNPRRRALLADLGAIPLDPAGDDLPERVAERLGSPATLVFDAVGASGSLADAFACSRYGARVVLVGMNAPRVDLEAYAVSTEERTLIGSFCYSADDFRRTAEWAGTAPAVLARLIEDRVGLDDAPRAFADLAKGESHASKVLVFPQGVPALREAQAREVAR